VQNFCDSELDQSTISKVLPDQNVCVGSSCGLQVFGHKFWREVSEVVAADADELLLVARSIHLLAQLEYLTIVIECHKVERLRDSFWVAPAHSQVAVLLEPDDGYLVPSASEFEAQSDVWNVIARATPGEEDNTKWSRRGPRKR